ncbi:hypothetical protein [Akkermansia sp.]|uniref:hypothetical protein n=1 Tax=Akkermansia sp. TaxID=1872421 RepID=UPI003A87C6CC
MKIPALLLSVATGFSGLGSLSSGEEISPPPLRLELKQMVLKGKRRPADREKGWNILLGWLVPQAPGWEIYCCHDEPVRVTLKDSVGRKAPDVKSMFLNLEDRIFGRMDVPEWLPSAGAQWVEAKGELPVVISCREAVTEPVRVKLAKGASVPLVLEDAGMGKDGRAEDVKADMVVDYYGGEHSGKERKKKKLILKVVSEAPVGICDIELQTVEGMPVMTGESDLSMIKVLALGGIIDFLLDFDVDRDETFPEQPEPMGWRSKTTVRAWDIDPVEEGELQVSVRYSQGLRRYRILIDHKASLSGLFEGKEIKEFDGKCESSSKRPPASDDAAKPFSGVVKTEGEKVSAWLSLLSVGSRDVSASGADSIWMDLDLAVKQPAVFGDRADVEKQSLEVSDSLGHVVGQAVFDLTWLSSGAGEEGMTWSRFSGECSGLASPGAEWLRVQGTLRVPVAVVRDGPVYELPLQKEAELQIPVPGRADDGENVHDVAAVGETANCLLSLANVEEKEHGGVQVTVALEVEGVPFDLECFELVDGNDVLLKNIESAGTGRSFSPKDQKRSWNHNFKIGNAAGMEKLRVRLKYKADMETVDVPVDCKIGLGGLLPQTFAVKQP